MEEAQVKICDTTLREGAQTSGVFFELEEKLEIALELEKMRVDIIEAGFPVASKGDFDAAKKIAETLQQAEVAVLTRANQKDVDLARQVLAKAVAPRIHTFMATSDIHLEHKLQMTRSQMMAHAAEAVRYAKQFIQEVQFIAEDAFRSDWDFLCRVLNGVVNAGATSVCLADTVGYATPEEVAALVSYIKEHVPSVGQTVISIHCHNDLGMAAANTLAALKCGAMQAECAVGGLGERAGIASLEEITMALATRYSYYKKKTRIDTKQLYRISRLVSSISGIAVPPYKPIVGDHAFLHVAGGHQHSVMHHAETFEIMQPEAVGIQRSSAVLNKQSDRKAFQDRLIQLGYELPTEVVDSLFIRFQTLAERKTFVYDRDLEALLHEKKQQTEERYRLLCHSILSGTHAIATASVRLAESEGVLLEEASLGDGPVDALFKAIKKAMGREVRLKDYQLKAVTAGQDALGEAAVWIETDTGIFSGRGLSTDVLEATAKAYVNAVNKSVSGHKEVK